MYEYHHPCTVLGVLEGEVEVKGQAAPPVTKFYFGLAEAILDFDYAIELCLVPPNDENISSFGLMRQLGPNREFSLVE
jgi:hypothetical protein